jgi:hypothetical protein
MARAHAHSSTVPQDALSSLRPSAASGRETGLESLLRARVSGVHRLSLQLAVKAELPGKATTEEVKGSTTRRQVGLAMAGELQLGCGYTRLSHQRGGLPYSPVRSGSFSPSKSMGGACARSRATCGTKEALSRHPASS